MVACFQISLQVLAQVSKANANKMTNDLMMAMFDLDMLSSCSLTGKTYNSGPPKPTLDLQKVQAIIGKRNLLSTHFLADFQ